MYNLIVYGSLLNPKELLKHDIDLKNIECVKVKGFKRVFNQLPSWRETEGFKKAVLNIEKEQNCWFNAIVIKNLSKKYIEELDQREKGYDRISLKDDAVRNYKDESLKNCIIYKGKAGKQSDKIAPNPNYYKICLEGAKSHFKEFFADYMKTTYQNDLKGGVKLIR